MLQAAVFICFLLVFSLLLPGTRFFLLQEGGCNRRSSPLPRVPGASDYEKTFLFP